MMSQPHEQQSNEEHQDFITARMTTGLPASTESLLQGQTASHVDWGEAPAVEQFFGREQERATLRQWMIGERCRIVAVLGIGGVGKTALATMAAEQAQESFEYIFWRSLQNAPPLEYFLQQCLSCFASSWQATRPLDDVHSQLNALMDSLRRHRCSALNTKSPGDRDRVELTPSAGSMSVRFIKIPRIGMGDAGGPTPCLLPSTYPRHCRPSAM